MTTTIPIDVEKNFYCSQKFWWLSIDLSKQRSFSCCSAAAEKIDIKWLKNNPGQLFNTPSLQKERTMMLKNISVPSCDAACWQPESRGLASRRSYYKTDQITHTDIKSDVEVLNIYVDTRCNMTCVYCCKQYSSSWLNDIIKNGPYPVSVNNRYAINDLDLIVQKLGQKKIQESNLSQFLSQEIGKIINPKLREISISGGEPFLYNNLISLVRTLSSECQIDIFSGLGVDEKRFSRIIKALSNFKNVRITISADSIGSKYEFIRYGNTWDRFQRNLDTIRSFGVDYKFHATLSNLTLFGIRDLIKYANGSIVGFNLCNDPDFLSINVLDPISKQMIIDDIDSYPQECKDDILSAMGIEPSNKQRYDLSSYLVEFSKRRNISLDVFPDHFVDWVKGDLNVV